MSGSVLQPGDAEYTAAVQLWTLRDTQSAILARCTSVSDVQQAVSAARQFHLPLSVRGGGHDWAARALCPGIVLDLRLLNAVAVDSERNTATFGGGALVEDVADAVSAVGLAVVVGSTGVIGMTGFTLAGGLGLLTSQFGMGSDNILSAQLVLADGSLTTASAEQDADLYWAIRGGGGAFGVGTAMTCRAHPLTRVLSGMVMFPLAEAAAVLQGFQSLLADVQLGLQAGLLRGPDGNDLCFISPQLIGDVSAGETTVAKINALGHPLMSNVRVQPWRETLRAYDPFIVSGRHNFLDGRSLPRLTPAAIQSIVEAANELPQHGMIVFHDQQGAAIRVDSSATASANRASEYRSDDGLGPRE